MNVCFRGSVSVEVYDIFLNRLPKIDLHGFDRESARVMTNDFVEDAFCLGYTEIVIIHGIGTGVVKDAVHEALFRNKKVRSYQLDSRNVGCTVVQLRRKGDLL